MVNTSGEIDVLIKLNKGPVFANPVYISSNTRTMFSLSQISLVRWRNSVEVSETVEAEKGSTKIA